jgi:hypothetical protein
MGEQSEGKRNENVCDSETATGCVTRDENGETPRKYVCRGREQLGLRGAILGTDFLQDGGVRLGNVRINCESRHIDKLNVKSPVEKMEFARIGLNSQGQSLLSRTAID